MTGEAGLPLIVGLPGVLGWSAGRPNGAPCGHRVGMPVAGRIAHRAGPRCQGSSEKLGTVLEVDLFIIKAISYLGRFLSDSGCLGVLGCLCCCARLTACFVGVLACAASGY